MAGKHTEEAPRARSWVPRDSKMLREAVSQFVPQDGVQGPDVRVKGIVWWALVPGTLIVSLSLLKFH